MFDDFLEPSAKKIKKEYNIPIGSTEIPDFDYYERYLEKQY